MSETMKLREFLELVEKKMADDATGSNEIIPDQPQEADEEIIDVDSGLPDTEYNAGDGVSTEIGKRKSRKRKAIDDEIIEQYKLYRESKKDDMDYEEGKEYDDDMPMSKRKRRKMDMDMEDDDDMPMSKRKRKKENLGDPLSDTEYNAGDGVSTDPSGAGQDQSGEDDRNAEAELAAAKRKRKHKKGDIVEF